MKTLIVSGLAAAALAAGALTSPSFAQTQSDQQMQPGTGGTSKPGVQGLPGSKAGPTVRPNRKPAAPTQRATNPDSAQSTGRFGAPSGNGTMPQDQTGNSTMQQDQSKVPGMPGNKSGAAPAPSQ